MRVDRIWAIARRDWRAELKGPQGVWLPIVMAALLVPSSAVRLPMAEAVEAGVSVKVSGDVPPEVLQTDLVELVPRGGRLRFKQRGETLVIRGEDPSLPIRAILDRDDGVDITLERFDLGYIFPGRSLLFALISASTLTGAISASIGGERSNHTLTTLLAAAVSRLEIVLGKLTAWGGLGAFTALGAALLSVALGRIEAGGWLLPLPWVPIATTALGLWLVRRATDVIAASTTLLRVLPVLLVTSGLLAWVLGRIHLLLGAVVPIGGALIASGDTWPGVMPLIVSTLSSMAFTVFCVVGSARELEHPSTGAPLQLAAGLGALIAAAWWLPCCTSLLWSEAGNFLVTQQIPVETGMLAGALSFGLFSVVAAGRSDGPMGDLDLRVPAPRELLFGIGGAGIVAVVMTYLVGAWPLVPPGSFLSSVAERLAVTAFPVRPIGLAVLLIFVEELLFRGWLAKRLGGLGSGAIYALVKAPFDPLGAAAMATTLGVIGAQAGPLGSIVARLGALIILLSFGA